MTATPSPALDEASPHDGHRVLVVANPRAGTGTRDALATTTAALRAAGCIVEVGITDAPGDGTRLARLGVASGWRHVVVVGGDGTLNEVVNGLVDVDAGTPRAAGLRLGIVGAGTGSDFARTFGLDRRPEVAVRHALHTTTMAIDVARIRFTGPDGRPGVRAFVNMATIGWTAAVVGHAARLPRSLRGSRYVAAAIAAAPTMRVAPVGLDLDHTHRDDAVCEVIVANGQFFGAGIKVAPRALPDDGRLNVQTWATGPVDVLRELPNVRVGEHLGRPDVHEWQSATVRVEPSGAPMPVEADGEPLGTTPVEIDLLPGVLDLAV